VLREQAKTLSRALMAVDVATVAMAYWLTPRLAASSMGAGIRPVMLPVWLPGVVFVAVFHLAGGYRSFRMQALLAEAKLVIESAILTGILLLVPQPLRLGAPVQFGLFFGFAALVFLYVTAGRMALRATLRFMRSQGYNVRYYLVAGTGESTREIAQRLSGETGWGIRVIGHVTPFPEAAPCGGEPALGSTDQLEAILQARVVDGVLFLANEVPEASLRRALACCQRLGIESFVDLQPFHVAREFLSLGELAGSPLLVVGQTRLHQYHAWFKRLFDVIVSAGALILLSPLMLAIALLIKASARGEVFFRQLRVGVNGRRFVLLKFRTMVANAEELRASVAALNEMDGPVFKARTDPRVTWIGRYLRKASLDELPQLWNVLRGDMSLVGPRPPLPEEVEQYQGWQRRRLCVRPGLTCLWQVSGRNRLNFDTWMKLDLDYIDHWSWWLDLKILLRTVPAMMRGE
jgi:exopolysaccharide biosynthesis polyprenyl glycosylphosphotransferase